MYGRLYGKGTVLWRSTANPYRPGHKRSNWFVGVNFFDEVEFPEIAESDIVYNLWQDNA